MDFLIKYLDVLVDGKLSWSPKHCRYVIKATKSLNRTEGSGNNSEKLTPYGFPAKSLTDSLLRFQDFTIKDSTKLHKVQEKPYKSRSYLQNGLHLKSNQVTIASVL